jgi:hypothetical protein
MNQNCVSEVAAVQSEISSLAFQLWKRAGCPEGRDLEFWLTAETGRLAPRKPEAIEMQPVAAKSAAKRASRVRSNKA